MAVQFPTPLAPWVSKPRFVSFDGIIQPPLGGAEQRLGRLGSRYEVDVAFPSMNGRYAKAMAAARKKAKTLGQTIVMAWPQPIVTANFGSPVVSGAGQSGSLLVVSGLAKGEIEPDTFFSFVVAGRNYLHSVTDAVTVGSSGVVTLQIAPMIRGLPLPDQTPLNFQNPQIEGFISGNAEDWTVDMLTKTSVHSFTIRETQ